MKKNIILTAMLMAVLDMNAQISYRNPIIPGYHPDPSICRVGDTFYLVNSSFCSFPGVPLSSSKDLVHWTPLNPVLTRDSQLPLQGATSWTGIYAPTIRYHEGVYYMITTNIGHGGNFLVSSKNPNGPWSEPVWLKQQGIDPSLYFEKGKCYMCSNPDNAIYLCEINPATGEQLTESKMIWKGDGGRYPEGPHIYFKDGYYYLLCSEGGTELAHHLTIARSRRIDGPYERNPDNPILTNCNVKGQDKIIQGTGHGDFFQDAEGNWWITFLAYRNFGGSYHHLGRETYLAPVKWDAGEWPVVNGGEAIDTLMNGPLPKSDVQPSSVPQWVYIQNPVVENYQSTANGWRLKGHGTLSENQQPTFMGIRQERPDIDIHVSALSRGGEGGISLFQINDGHLDLMVSDDKVSVHVKVKSIDYRAAEARLTKKGGMTDLRITSDGLKYVFYYRETGTAWNRLGEMDCSLISTEVMGGFTGVIMGLFSEGRGEVQFTNVQF